MDSNIKYFLVGVLTIAVLILAVPAGLNILEDQKQETFRKEVREVFQMVHQYYEATKESSGKIQDVLPKEKKLQGTWYIDQEQIVLKNVRNEKYMIEELKQIQKDTTFELIKITEQTKLPDDNESQQPPVQEETYLIDIVQIGDFIAYDAGLWTGAEISDKFTTHDIDSSKNNSFICGENMSPNSGWRVLDKKGTGAEGTITIVHAGIPDCYTDDQTETNIDLLNSRAQEYINGTYANTARSITCGDLQEFDANACYGQETQINHDVFNAGASYFLATKNVSGSMWMVDNMMIKISSINPSGFRPVIELKPGIRMTEGQGTQENAYQLSI